MVALAVHAADPRRVRPVHFFQHRSDLKQAPALIGGLRFSGEPSKLLCRVIRSTLPDAGRREYLSPLGTGPAPNNEPARERRKELSP